MAGNDLVKQAEKRLIDVMGSYQKSLTAVLGDAMKQKRFMWLVVNNIRANPALLGCTPLSFINSVMLASQMGIEIRRNSAYLVPFGKECQLLIDYRAKIELARRTGKVGSIGLNLVHAGDEFDYEETSAGVHLHHRPLQFAKQDGRLIAVDPKDRGEVVLGYSLARLIGFPEPQIELMSLAQIEAIRRRAHSGARDLTLDQIRKIDGPALPFRDPHRVPWVTDWDQMARKTLAHRAANYWPQSPELAMSQEIDDTNDSGNQPIAIGAEELTDIMDPADNRPLVDIPDTPAAQRAAKEAYVDAKIAEAEGRKTAAAAPPTSTPAPQPQPAPVQVQQPAPQQHVDAPPPNLPNLPEWPDNLGDQEWIRVDGHIFRFSQETSNYQEWVPPTGWVQTAEPAPQPAASKRERPVFGKRTT